MTLWKDTREELKAMKTINEQNLSKLLWNRKKKGIWLILRLGKMEDGWVGESESTGAGEEWRPGLKIRVEQVCVGIRLCVGRDLLMLKLDMRLYNLKCQQDISNVKFKFEK